MSSTMKRPKQVLSYQLNQLNQCEVKVFKLLSSPGQVSPISLLILKLQFHSYLPKNLVVPTQHHFFLIYTAAVGRLGLSTRNRRHQKLIRRAEQRHLLVSKMYITTAFTAGTFLFGDGFKTWNFCLKSHFAAPRGDTNVTECLFNHITIKIKTQFFGKKQIRCFLCHVCNNE